MPQWQWQWQWQWQFIYEKQNKVYKNINTKNKQNSIKPLKCSKSFGQTS